MTSQTLGGGVVYVKTITYHPLAPERARTLEHIVVERTINAPIEAAYDWCTETTNWQASPLILRNRLKRAGNSERWGAGSTRSHLWLIGWFLEEITASDRPRSHSYIVVKSLPPLRHEGGTMAFAAVPEGTKITWDTTAEAKLPVGAALFTKRVAKPLLSRVFDQILRLCDEALKEDEQDST